MKNVKSVGMFAAIAFAVGMAGINLSDGTFALENSTPSTNGGIGILGHVELIHTDSEGNILGYQQTDNMIVHEARNCIAMVLFELYNSGCPAATAGGLGNYTAIGLSNSTTLLTDTGIGYNNLNGTGVDILNTDGLYRAFGTTISMDQVATITDDSTAQSPETADVTISRTFTYSGEQANNAITQAGLFNSTSTSVVTPFALKNFPSSVSMNNGDSLTVNWEISISGSNDAGP